MNCVCNSCHRTHFDQHSRLHTHEEQQALFDKEQIPRSSSLAFALGVNWIFGVLDFCNEEQAEC